MKLIRCVFNREGLFVRFEEEPNPEGVFFSVSGGGEENTATIALLYIPPRHSIASYFKFAAGVSAVLTNGSVIVKVISSVLLMTLMAEDGSEATVELSENNSLTFEPINAIFYAPATNTEDVIVFIDNTEVTIVPGQFIYVDDGVLARRSR